MEELAHLGAEGLVALAADDQAAQAQVAAQLAANREGISVVRITLDGFDTHANQAPVHANLLRQLDLGLGALRDGLRRAWAGRPTGRRLAAMAPGTRIGAAHPVLGAGQDVEKEAGKDMARKVENDTAAFARSIAKARGRNPDWAEKAVRESVSATAGEALALHVVDVVVPDLAGAAALAWLPHQGWVERARVLAAPTGP